MTTTEPAFAVRETCGNAASGAAASARSKRRRCIAGIGDGVEDNAAATYFLSQSSTFLALSCAFFAASLTGASLERELPLRPLEPERPYIAT